MASLQSIPREALHEDTNLNSAPDISTCSTCALCDLKLCTAAKVTKKRSEAKQYNDAPPLVASVQTIPAKRTILHPNEWSEFVTIVCEGWATSSIALADGRRQILSFVLPGDIIPALSFFEPVFGRLSEAVTETTYRNFKRQELKAALLQNSEASERLTRIWIEDRLQADKLALALGRQTADERIARLILQLMERLEQRGLAQGLTIEFPLRQHHIADAVGLTPVHVSKVMSEFRRRGLIEINGRSLTILDQTGLRRAATL